MEKNTEKKKSTEKKIVENSEKNTNKKTTPKIEEAQSLSSATPPLICVKNSMGTVYILDKEGAEESFAMGPDDLQAMRQRNMYMPRLSRTSLKVPVRQRGNGQPQTITSSHKSPSATSIQSSVDSGASRKILAQMPTKKTMLKQIKDKILLETEAIRKVCDPVLQAERAIIGEINRSLAQLDFLEKRRKEMVHRSWSLTVCDPIKRKVLEVVNSQRCKDKDRQMRELQREYLEHINKGGFVFLHTMDQGQKYAQALSRYRQADLKANLPPLNDPLFRHRHKRNIEKQSIVHLTTGEVYPLKQIDKMPLPPIARACLSTRGKACLEHQPKKRDSKPDKTGKEPR